MNSDHFKRIGNEINEWSWKKIVVIGIGVVFVMFIFHEFILWNSFREAKAMIDSLNVQIENHQKQIHKIISDSDNEFQERRKLMDQNAENMEKFVNDFHAKVRANLDRADREMEEKDKKFDEFFKEAPATLLKAHEEMGKKMEADFYKSVDRNQKAFQKRQEHFFDRADAKNKANK